MRTIRPQYLITGLTILLLISLIFAIAIGAVTLPFSDVLSVVFPFAGTVSDDAQTYHSIIASIRLPRALLAAIIGALLAVSGAAMQGLFRNPLADPSLIGVTAGASLGGSLTIFLLGSGTFIFFNPLSLGLALPLISVGAFIGGLLAVCLVYSLARNSFGTSVATMLLAGIAITALSASFTSLLEYISDNEMLRRISLWRMGGLDGANQTSVVIAAIMLLIVAIVLPRYSQALNALLLGESEARYLGINVEKLKRYLIVLTAACVGISVALAGTITFVGLVVPHMVRLVIGPDHRFLLPASALAGALLLVLADLCARLVLAPAELPVGLVTAFIGVPFFISLLQRRYRHGMS